MGKLDATHVCPSSQFHLSINEMVSDAIEECPEMLHDEARGIVLHWMLMLLVPAGNC